MPSIICNSAIQITSIISLSIPVSSICSIHSANHDIRIIDERVAVVVSKASSQKHLAHGGWCNDHMSPIQNVMCSCAVVNQLIMAMGIEIRLVGNIGNWPFVKLVVATTK